MREQTKRFNELLTEYKELKNKVFGNNTFVMWDDKEKDMARYSVLFQLFHPQYRTKDFVNPLTNN